MSLNVLNFWPRYTWKVIIKKFMVELMKAINSTITDLIRRDLADARKSYEVLHHTAASIKLYILTYAL